MDYVANCDWVDLYYDGEHRGIYLLGEKNSVGSTGVDITDLEDAYEDVNETYGEDVTTAIGTNKYGLNYQYTVGLTDPEDISGGYLLELNGNDFDEASGFYTRQGMAFNVKSPEYASENAVAYISELYQEFEDAVYAQDEDGNYTGINPTTGKHYYEYVDLDSLVQVVMIQQFARNNDGFYSSMFMYKDTDDVLHFGPVWDQELTFGSGWNKHIKPERESYHYLEAALIKIPDFKEALAEYYNNSFKSVAENLIAENGTIATSVAKISSSVAMDSKLWPYVYIGDPSNTNHLWADGTTYESIISDMQQWIVKRFAYLDEKLKIEDTTGDGTDSNEPGGTLDGSVSGGDTLDGSVSGGDTTGGNTSDDETATGVPAVTVKPTPTYYSVTNSTVTDGSITFNTNSAAQGETVTLTVTPKDGYTLETLVVKSGNRTLSVKAVAGGYAFTMPAGDVTIEATFTYNDNACPSEPYDDVDTSKWYHESVDYAVSNGLMEGTGDTTFEPNTNATRAMLVTILHRLEGEPDAGALTFADVASDTWYSDAVAWANETGIVEGYSEDIFAPNDNVTREQMVTILYRYAKYKGYDVSGQADLTTFTDSSSVSSWASDAMAWAVDAQLVEGMSNGKLEPTGTATRAQIATILMRFCKLIA
jgi:hypothetical protein